MLHDRAKHGKLHSFRSEGALAHERTSDFTVGSYYKDPCCAKGALRRDPSGPPRPLRFARYRASSYVIAYDVYLACLVSCGHT
jgi:hypothetical protein